MNTLTEPKEQQMNASAGETMLAAVLEDDRILHPWGPDIVFESAGVLPAAEQAFKLTRRGTRINMFGVITPGEVPVSPADVHWKETRMDASFSVTPRAFTKAIDLMERGKADPSKIVTHRFPLSQMRQALEAMESPQRIKVIISS